MIAPNKKFHPLRHSGRLKTIIATFARHGFQSVVERIKLGRFSLSSFSDPDIENLTAPERLRRCFEELGPTFVKVGQMLGSRPDLVAPEFVAEFRKLQDQVPSLPFKEIEPVLVEHFGRDLSEIFLNFEESPLAAASIGQVYRAQLISGEPVVVKVQRPGIESVIEDDLAILHKIAELIELYIPEWKRYHPGLLVEEAARSLNQEINFAIEANNIRRFAQNFSDDRAICIPKVFLEYTGRRVLVLEELQGIPLSHRQSIETSQINVDSVLRQSLRAYLKMVFVHGLFHGDLHAGNIFAMQDGRVGFIDFGAVGRLNRRTQTAVAEMLLSLADEDYERLAFTYIDLAPVSEQSDGDLLARQLRDLIAPLLGMSLKHVNVGRLLLESTSLSYEHGLVLPADLILFFKSLVTIEGMGRLYSPEFDFLTVGLQFSDELVQSRLEPKRVSQDVKQAWREMSWLLSTAPRQLRQILRRVSRPGFSFKIEVEGMEDLGRAERRSADLQFFGMMSASLFLCGSILLTFWQESSRSAWLPYCFFAGAMIFLAGGLLRRGR